MEQNKKKILITIFSMHIGGAERSLLGLLNAFDYNKFDVTLMVYQHKGEFMKYIPKEVKLLPYIPSYDVFEVSIKKLLFSKRIIFGIARVFAKVECSLKCKMRKQPQTTWIKLQYNTKYILPLLPSIPAKYDLAIGFIGIHDVLVKKADAAVKAGWIHTDYDEIVADKKMDMKTYSSLDYIVHVSPECQKTFLKIYPQFQEKAIVVENILSPAFIRQQAIAFDPSYEMRNRKDVVTLLSIGRFCTAKNFGNIPLICNYIISKGYKIVWYIIGYGADEHLIQAKIKEYNMEDYVVLLGKKENPYPYIKACNIYVQPSRYEGKSVAVREAQILRKPVIITNFATAASQVNNGCDGVIVPLNNEKCAQGIIDLIQCSSLQQKLVDFCAKNDYGNEYEIQKVYALCGGGS